MYQTASLQGRGRRWWGVAALSAGLMWLMAAAPALAMSFDYTFEAIPYTNSSADALAGEAQLRLEVSGEPGSGTVTFTFSVTGPSPMSITAIYFYDGVLGINGTSAHLSGSTGLVVFALDSRQNKVSPPALPGGQDIGLPKASVVFSADSDPPTQPQGINPGESLSITFTLASGYHLHDVVNSLAGWSDKVFQPGDLVVGVHVQGFADGGSESFVHFVKPVGVVPLPGTALLLGSALSALVLWARGRRSVPPGRR